MIEKVVTGGQAGADQAAWRAARAAGVPTGGWMPLGFLTEDGPRPEFAELYGAVEMPTDIYRLRTEENVRRSDGTLWVGMTTSKRAKATLLAAEAMSKRRLIVRPGDGGLPSDVARWIRAQGIRTLNVAGNRESVSRGVGERVERFILGVLHQLAQE
jgi:hypothetical protein